MQSAQRGLRARQNSRPKCTHWWLMKMCIRDSLYGATADVERAACMDARDAGFGGREHESDRDGARDGAEGEEARHE